MEQLTIDSVYGNALFQAAKETDKIELISKQVDQIEKIFQEERDFFEIISNPVLSAEDRKNAVTTVFNGEVCDEILNFIYVLIDKGRMIHYERIIKSYKKLVYKDNHLAEGEVYSVRPLDAEQKSSLEKEVGELLKENVHLENKIEKGLIGGFKILVNGKIIDASIKEKLKKLEEALR